MRGWTGCCFGSVFPSEILVKYVEFQGFFQFFLKFSGKFQMVESVVKSAGSVAAERPTSTDKRFFFTG